MGFGAEVKNAIGSYLSVKKSKRDDSLAESANTLRGAQTDWTNERARLAGPESTARTGALNEQSAYYKYLRSLQAGQAPTAAVPTDVPSAAPPPWAQGVPTDDPTGRGPIYPFAEGGLVPDPDEDGDNENVEAGGGEDPYEDGLAAAEVGARNMGSAMMPVRTAQAVPTQAQPQYVPKPPRGMQNAPRPRAPKEDDGDIVTPELRQQINPDGSLSEGQTNIIALGVAWRQMRARGNEKKAEQAASALMNEYYRWAKTYHDMAAQLTEKGDLNGAAQAMMKAYGYVPNGTNLKAGVVAGKDGIPRIAFAVTDEKTGKVVGHGSRTPEELVATATGFSPEEFRKEVERARDLRTGKKPDDKGKKDEAIKMSDRKTAAEMIDAAWPQSEKPDPAEEELKDAAYNIFTANKNLRPHQAKKVVLGIARPGPKDKTPLMDKVEGGFNVRTGKSAPVFVPQDQFDALMEMRDSFRSQPKAEERSVGGALRSISRNNPAIDVVRRGVGFVADNAPGVIRAAKKIVTAGDNQSPAGKARYEEWKRKQFRSGLGGQSSGMAIPTRQSAPATQYNEEE